MIVVVSKFLPFQILTQWGRKRVFLSPYSWRNLLSSHWLVLGHMSIIEPITWPRGWGRRVGLGESGCTLDPRLGHLTHSRQPGLHYGSLSAASGGSEQRPHRRNPLVPGKQPSEEVLFYSSSCSLELFFFSCRIYLFREQRQSKQINTKIHHLQGETANCNVALYIFCWPLNIVCTPGTQTIMMVHGDPQKLKRNWLTWTIRVCERSELWISSFWRSIWEVDCSIYTLFNNGNSSQCFKYRLANSFF